MLVQYHVLYFTLLSSSGCYKGPPNYSSLRQVPRSLASPASSTVAASWDVLVNGQLKGKIVRKTVFYTEIIEI